MLTPRIVAENLRQRLNLPDGSKAARFINAIPEVLKATGRKIAANPQLRPLLITPKATTSLALVAGAVNLVTAAYPTHKILLEYIDKGHIYHSSVVHPLRRIPIASKGFAQQLSDYYYYYIDGDLLYAQQADKTALTGSLSFAVPYYPSNLAALPDSEEVEKIFLDKMYEWAMSDQAPGNDAAQDEKK